MRSRAWFASLALAWALTAFPAAAAGAAPFVKGDVEVQLWPETMPGQAIAIVAVRLPENTELPATVRLPIPEGTTIDWAGEISGTDPGSDPGRAYEIKEGDGGKYAEFEVSTSRDAQIEVSGIKLSGSDGVTTAQFTHVASAPASNTSFSIRLPAGTEPVKTSPEIAGPHATNSVGESLYPLAPRVMTPGESVQVSVSYRAIGAQSGTQAPQTPASGGGSGDGVMIALLVALAIALAALVAAVLVQRGKTPASIGDEDDAEDDVDDLTWDSPGRR